MANCWSDQHRLCRPASLHDVIKQVTDANELCPLLASACFMFPACKPSIERSRHSRCLDTIVQRCTYCAVPWKEKRSIESDRWQAVCRVGRRQSYSPMSNDGPRWSCSTKRLLLLKFVILAKWRMKHKQPW